MKMADQTVVVLRRNRPGTKAEVCTGTCPAYRECVKYMWSVSTHYKILLSVKSNANNPSPSPHCCSLGNLLFRCCADVLLSPIRYLGLD